MKKENKYKGKRFILYLPSAWFLKICKSIKHILKHSFSAWEIGFFITAPIKWQIGHLYPMEKIISFVTRIKATLNKQTSSCLNKNKRANFT